MVLLFLWPTMNSCLDHVQGEVFVLASHGQVFDLLPIGCLIFVGDQAYHCCVVRKLNDGVGFVLGHAVVGEQGVQEGIEHAPLRGPCVEDQREAGNSNKCILCSRVNSGSPFL